MKNTLPALSFVAIPIAVLIGYGLIVPNTNSSTSSLPSWLAFRVGTSLADFFQLAADVLTPPSQRALELQSLYWKPTILRALTENGLIDAVDGKSDCMSIAANLGLSEDFTCRFLRAGTAINILTTTRNNNVYKLTPTGEFLRRDNPETLADIYDLVNSELFHESLHAAATKSIKSGRSGVQEAFGIEVFEYFAQDSKKDEGAVFDSAMNQISKNIAMALVQEWVPPFGKATVCDLGGGKGTIIAALCKNHADLKGILFDLPESSERAESYIADAGLSSRVDVVTGDFFTKLPEELEKCDVFYLKAIFHDWDDDACVSIIRNIRDIARRGAKIVGHDIVLGIGDGNTIENRKIESDITMMAVCSGGRERTKDEYFKLFQNAGIESKPRLIKLRDLTSVVEVDL